MNSCCFERQHGALIRTADAVNVSSVLEVLQQDSFVSMTLVCIVSGHVILLGFQSHVHQWIWSYSQAQLAKLLSAALFGCSNIL